MQAAEKFDRTALPGELDQWWRARSQMRLVQHGKRWPIEGPERPRARVAYATVENQQIVYTVEKASGAES